ncbi:MAG: hypothetical protein R3B97_01675 [Dehalococcoidia bacterium]|nr:hypothetical protein [Dehalococcoidia bacterium]MCB9486279.1 hypothetical protein [Thermoflexaceae bacterium]
MDDSGEARLLAAAREGSAEALAEVVRRQTPLVFDFLLAVTGDSVGAEALAVEALTDFAQEIGRVRSPGEVSPRAFRAAWRVLDKDGWFSEREPGGETPAFPELSRRRAAVLDLVGRQGVSDAGLARVIGVSEASAALIRRRVTESATTDLGPTGSQRLEAYRAVRRRNARPEMVAAIQRALSAAAPSVRPTDTDARPAGGRRRPVPMRAALFFGLSLAGLASLLALLLVAPMSPLALTRMNDGALPAATNNTGSSATPRVVVITVTVTAAGGRSTPSATASASPPGTRTPAVGAGTPAGSRTPTSSATATATRTSTTAAGAGTPSPTNAPPTRTATPTSIPPTATPTATATPTVCAPRLQASVSAVTIPAGGLVVPVLNVDTCGAAPFDAAGSGWLVVTPASGSIAPFGSVDLRLSVRDSPSPGDTATLTIVGPANQITIVATFSG